MQFPIFQINVNAGRREADQDAVQKLADSISKVGLLNPITVDQEYTLIAGLHRLEAAKRLGWTEIECTVKSLDGLLAELAEIDENLIRRKLHYTDEGKQLTRRKEIYETLHPEIKNGGNRRAVADGEKSTRTKPFRSGEVKPFSADTAEKIGTSRRAGEQKRFRQDSRRVQRTVRACQSFVRLAFVLQTVRALPCELCHMTCVQQSRFDNHGHTRRRIRDRRRGASGTAFIQSRARRVECVRARRASAIP